MKRIAMQIAAAVGAVVMFVGSARAEDITLTKDEVWTDGRTLSGTIDLNGHKLTVSSLAGDAAITSTADAGYEILEYLDSDSKAYVDTGVAVSGNTVIDIDVRLLKDPGTSYVSYVGARNEASRSGQLGGWFHGMLHHKGVTESEGSVGQAALNTDYSVHLDKAGPCTINGGEPFATGNGDGNDYTITVFAMHQSTVKFGGYFRVYSCRIAYGSDVQRNLKPARRLSDGALGLLDVKDTTNLAFYPNKNSTGAFSAGPVVSDAFAMPAELHIAVPSGTTENSTVAITGPVRLVKEGAGMFVATKQNQAYNGGTDVKAGTFRCGNTGDRYVYGAAGSRVTVREGAIFDCDGFWNHYLHTFVLDGGTMKNENDRATQREAWFADVSLTKDSFWSGRNYGFVGKGSTPCRLQMNGHLLTVDVTSSQYFFAADLTVAGGGEIYIRKGGSFAIGGITYAGQTTYDKYVKAETTTLRMGGGAFMDLRGEHVFGSYVSEYAAGYDTANTVIKVIDRFVPGVQWHATELQDGATLDLSDCTDTWNATCTFAKSKVTATATFAAGATIDVELGDRMPVDGMKLIGWTNADAPLSSVKFKISDTISSDGFMLQRDTDGLYVVAIVKKATWTGAVGTDCTNPENWICYDANNHVIVGARPGDVSEVTVSGEVQLDIPANSLSCASFTCDDVSLKGDCNWSGLGQPMNGPIDLAGHKLTVSSLAGDAVITSTADAGYEILEYLDSDSKAYVDTGVAVSGNTVIDIDVRLLKDPGTSYVSYVGARNEASRSGQLGGWFHGMLHHKGVTESEGSVGQAALNTDYSVHLDKAGPCTINGGEPFATGNGDGNDYTITVFAMHQSTVKFGGYFRVYSCRIAYGSDVQRNLKPARRLSDGALGLLDVKDTTNLAFYPNKNSTGAFSAGPVVSDAFAMPAELHIAVPSGTTENSTVAITGPVRLVKEGAGMFVATKQNQAYNGGTDVKAGTFRCGNTGDRYVYGAAGSRVTVREGAIFDCDGFWNHYLHTFVLDGGTMKNENDRATQREAWFADVSLTKDSFWSGRNYGFVGKGSTPCRLQMNGHLLTVDVTSSQYFFAADLTVAGGGEIYIRKGGSFAIGGITYAGQTTYDKYVKAETTTLRMGGGAFMDLRGEHVFGSYVSEYAAGYDTANTVIKVIDRFVPGVQWHATELQDGATLDLSDCTDTWNATCTFAKSKVTATATFAAGATINVDFGDRTISAGDKVIGWTPETAPAKGVKFLSKLGKLRKMSDGAYYMQPFMIMIR